MEGAFSWIIAGSYKHGRPDKQVKCHSGDGVKRTGTYHWIDDELYNWTKE